MLALIGGVHGVAGEDGVGVELCAVCAEGGDEATEGLKVGIRTTGHVFVQITIFLSAKICV